MNKLLTLSETAKALRLSRPTTSRLLQEGKLPGARLGGQWRVNAEALEQITMGGGRGQSRTEKEAA